PVPGRCFARCGWLTSIDSTGSRPWVCVGDRRWGRMNTPTCRGERELGTSLTRKGVRYGGHEAPDRRWSPRGDSGGPGVRDASAVGGRRTSRRRTHCRGGHRPRCCAAGGNRLTAVFGQPVGWFHNRRSIVDGACPVATDSVAVCRRRAAYPVATGRSNRDYPAGWHHR